MRVFVPVAQAYTRFYLIHILPAGAARTERIPRDAGRINLHFDRIVDERSHKDGSKRSHPFALCIVGRYAHEPVHPVFAFQIAVGVIALDGHRHGLDAGLIAILQVADGNLVVVRLAPAHIHTHQHRRPVLTLGTARTRVDLEHAAHLVGFFAKHVAELKAFDQLLRPGVSRIDLFFGRDAFFYILESERQFFGRIVYFTIQLDPFLKVFDDLHLRFGALGIFPECRVLCAQLFFF